MEIEFNGISTNELQKICHSHEISAEIFPLSARDPICPRETGREFGDGEIYYLVEESCWHGYYFCGDVRCGKTSTRHTSVHPSSINDSSRRGVYRKTKGRTSTSDCEDSHCHTSSDCDSSSDSIGALILFFIIIAAILLLITLLPTLIPIAALGIELGLAFLLGIFDILTFGIFRKRFKRVIVYFSKPLSKDQLRDFMKNSASLGGLPRHTSQDVDYLLSTYGTNGFWVLRTGAYLFLPSLIATILVFILQPESNFLFYMPIGTFISSILILWLGNSMIRNKTKQIASMT